MRAPITVVTLVALTSSALGCGATVEVPGICFTQANIGVPGAPAGASVQTPPVSFTVDVTNQVPLLRINASNTDLRIQDVTITPVGTSPDLSGIRTAKLQVTASGAAVDVVQYERNPAAQAPPAIVLGGDTVNIAPYLDNGRANLSFTLSGQPPRTRWTADVKTCLRGETAVSP